MGRCRGDIRHALRPAAPGREARRGGERPAVRGGGARYLLTPTLPLTPTLTRAPTLTLTLTDQVAALATSALREPSAQHEVLARGGGPTLTLHLTLLTLTLTLTATLTLLTITLTLTLTLTLTQVLARGGGGATEEGAVEEGAAEEGARIAALCGALTPKPNP